ncbi:hypothetical protein [Dyadobacter sp. CY343]|uniref:hypothetical protein n=1 Tax=Dyadobacter sp. CY343 TaxID=2907299 RepID=UPI001F468F19|nr:hypothetical protein [Dyadobacter sp. CY343]MCE7060645.1 hypothetical protein [Dyadobacter sp. CY343]
MKTSLYNHNNFSWIVKSVLFFKNHYLIILALGMAAALGRSAQLKAFGPISQSLHLVLEIGIQSARILIFIYALGLTNVKIGALRAIQIASSRRAWKQNWVIAREKMRRDWAQLLTNMIIYLLIAWVTNLLIDYAAYQTCLFAKLKSNEIISAQSSEWVIILFFKNLSVIPFTLIFNALFLLWITNRISENRG